MILFFCIKTNVLQYFNICINVPLRYNKRVTTRDNGNVQSNDYEKSKLNSTINVNSGAHTLTDDKITKSPFNKQNIATIKSKQNGNKDLITGAC